LTHTHVVKPSIHKIRNSTQTPSSNFKLKTDQNTLKKQQPQPQKQQHRQPLTQHQLQQQQLHSQQIKHLSHFPQL
ncbi:hypothetical protein, partial [Staphylococcus haemolyticus]|uniref:hypothetical protein n=1 Tax=Staphylococcus haemolyticus TaxID=1283 RepID=UPI001C930551